MKWVDRERRPVFSERGREVFQLANEFQDSVMGFI